MISPNDLSKFKLPTFSHLFLTLLISSFATTGVDAAKQCRLKARGAILTNQVPVAAPTSPANITPTSTATTASPSATLTTFNYGSEKVIGVNLGGWFVLEPWITPSIFENTGNDNVVDEFTLGQLIDPATVNSTLTTHWRTWITEADFVTMASAGINHVRIPFGYWAIPTGEPVAPFTPGAWPYLIQALKWAHGHGIHTIVDLHGAPGSQNGYDNSGQRTSNPQWAITPANVTRTINDLVFLANNTLGLIDILELVNEPGGFISSTWAANTRQFFQDAYNAVRAAVGNNLLMMIGDAFLGVDSWEGFLTGPSAEGVLMDYHQYQIFDDSQLATTMDQHITAACALIPDLQTYSQSNLWTIMGEWSGAFTDCAKWLNGRNVGARWDGSIAPGSQVFGTCSNVTGSSDNFSADYKTFLRQYWEVQSVLGDSVQGNIWWTWKAENADEWDYSKGLIGGWIPKDPTQRLYPNICG